MSEDTARQYVEAAWRARRSHGINPYLGALEWYEVALGLATRLDAVLERVALIESAGWKPKKKNQGETT